MNVRSATETLMAAAETFGESEPKECIIIWTDEGGDICWSSSTDSQTAKLGMLEMVKQIIIHRIEV